MAAEEFLKDDAEFMDGDESEMEDKTEQVEIPEVKHTTWKNEPTIADLKANIDDQDANDKSHIDNVERWLENLYIDGSAKIKKKKGNSVIQPKLIRKQAEWRYSSLSEPFLANSDLFNVYPVTAGDVKRARQNALVLNNQFNTKIDKIRFIDAYVRQAVDVGTVVVKVGWISKEEDITETVDTFDFITEPTGELAARFDALIQLEQTNPEEYLNWMKPGVEQALNIYKTTGQATIARKTGTTTRTKAVETMNQPELEIVDSRNIIVDPTCNGDYKKAIFIAERYKTNLASLRLDPNYFNLDKVMVESNTPVAHAEYEENAQQESNFNFRDKERAKIVVTLYYGEWDVHGTGELVPIVAAWCGDVLIRLQENPFPDRKPPYVIATYMPKRGSVFGEPDGELLEDNQKIVGAVTRGMIDLMAKSANSQTGMKSNMLDVVNRRRYLNGEDYEFNANVDVRSSIHQHVFPEIPQSAYSMLALQNNEAESLSGIKAFTSGISGDALGKSVANGRSALDAASKREVGIVRRLANGIIDIGRKIVAMNAVFLDEEETIRITAENFIAVRRDDLAGEFDLELAISTPEEDNKKAEELAFMLQTDTTNADPAERRIIRAEIARLRKMPGLAKRIEEYEPEPDPMEVQMNQMKMQHLGAQIAKEEALAMKHAAEAEAAGDRGAKDRTQAALNMAKAGEATGKARDYNSSADLKDLDYLQTQSGSKQIDELQKLDRKGDNEVKKEYFKELFAPKPQQAAASSN